MDQLFSLEDKVIVVTGGTGVFGNLLIDGITQAGGTVGILGRDRKTAEDKATLINRAGGKALALCADVSSKNDLNNVKKLVLDTYGKIDGLVNAPGGSTATSVRENQHDIFNINLGRLKSIMEQSLWGTILPTQVFGDIIVRQQEGSIVNLCGNPGRHVTGQPLGHSMAIASVESFTKWFAAELSRSYGEAIKVNTIIPGFLPGDRNRTFSMRSREIHNKEKGKAVLQLTPFKRPGAPEDLSRLVVWLLSPASRFITGATINVESGFSNEESR